MNEDWITKIMFNWNTVAWVSTNLLIAYIAVMLVVFVTGYYVLFNPKVTTAGRYIFRFFISLIAVIGLVFISLFVDPIANNTWSMYPQDTAFWRPTVRLVGYAYVAFTITSLAILLIVRKWHPHKLRTASDYEFVKTRQEHNDI
jgi:hypothetical protein